MEPNEPFINKHGTFLLSVRRIHRNNSHELISLSPAKSKAKDRAAL
jgi:hypothetical protein